MQNKNILTGFFALWAQNDLMANSEQQGKAAVPPQNDVPAKAAFTLAEVLITLGIIGIVAAMTLPAITSKYRAKALEALFKKRYSEISQALLNIKKDEITFYGNIKGREIQKYLVKEFRTAKEVPRYIYTQDKSLQKSILGYELPTYKNFSNTADYTPRAMDDGCLIVNKEFFIFINNDSESLTRYQFIVDVNGIKDPNRMGYDVFIFELSKNDALVLPVKNNYLCSKNSTDPFNGLSCAYFAFNDKNYFKNLNF